LLASLHGAICRKDIPAILRHYSPDAVIFNVKPPYQIRNRDAWQGVWQSSLSHFPPSFNIETRDLLITVTAGLAVVHCLFRFTNMPGTQPWIRQTIVFQREARQREAGQKENGHWCITHEHSSVPFDPETLKVVFEAD
jgi:ketosteroid isomerase-like protein